MKLSRIFLMILMTVVIKLCLSGCNKNTERAIRNCKIMSLIAGSNVYVFTYNSDGKLNSFIGSTTNKLTYAGNTITITSSSGGTIFTVTTVTLNSNGLANNVSVTDAAGVKLSNTLYEYNGTELSKSTVTNGFGGAAVVTTYTWKGGNMISSQTGTNVTTFDYFNDIPAQQGDVWHVVNLQMGYELYRTKNALKMMEASGVILSNTYKFDAAGRIVGIIDISRGLPTEVNFLYQCR